MYVYEWMFAYLKITEKMNYKLIKIATDLLE